MRTAAFVLLLSATGFTLGCGKTTPTSGPDVAVPGPDTKTPSKTQPEPVVKSDKERLQGVWAVESIESSDPVFKQPPDLAKNLRYHFVGDRLVVTRQGEMRGFETVSLDSNKSPKCMDIASYNQKGEPSGEITPGPKGETITIQSKGQWIYKFAGDSLVLAVTEWDRVGYRPTDFKPLASEVKRDDTGQRVVRPEVLIVTLKKLNEPAISADKIPPVREMKK